MGDERVEVFPVQPLVERVLISNLVENGGVRFEYERCQLSVGLNDAFNPLSRRPTDSSI